ncbi:MAG: hypothetical protein ABI456_20045 [Ktedonobacteraceae bacterium]|nr:hypothetical protein [Chloroflexota bacterium]
MIRIHGFDWKAYGERVMPAFARWLIDSDPAAAHLLFERTRFAREERFLPKPMQRLRVWPRARTFVEALPHGLHSRREYQLLCAVEQFTPLSDRYMYSHIPQLYQNSDALCSIWGAIIEELCLPWNQDADPARAGGTAANQEAEPDSTLTAPVHSKQSAEPVPSEMVSLLNAAGLSELAREVDEQAIQAEYAWGEPATPPGYHDALTAYDEDAGDDEETTPEGAGLRGLILGQHPNTLRVRGWLASISVRAMVLFEYLACGRRGLPFGAEMGTVRTYVGYLTPAEVTDLATLLQGVQPPAQSEAEDDYRDFRLQLSSLRKTPRLIDEILPTNAREFLHAVHVAELEGLGLICSRDA